MKRAVKRDAVNKELFHFREVIIPGQQIKFSVFVTAQHCVPEGNDNDTDNGKGDRPSSAASPVYKVMDINTIMNGNVRTIATQNNNCMLKLKYICRCKIHIKFCALVYCIATVAKSCAVLS